MQYIHVPVLLKEVIELLDPKPNENFVDCTIGQGGHSEKILEKTFPRGKVLGIDLDEKSIEVAKERLKKFQKRIILVQDNFVNFKEIVNGQIANFPISGVLFDLGLSLAQLKDREYGFSFLIDAPLDMRLGKSQLTAQEIVNHWPEKDLREIFRKYGEEKFFPEIAQEILKQRSKKKIETTKQLADLVIRVYQQKSRGKKWRIHPATKVFQALRIAVNQELNNLKKVLPQVLEILKPGGKIAVISFHSLEDRIVKRFFLEHKHYLKIITKKPVRPTTEEIKENPRSRSAKMRVAEKLNLKFSS